MKPQYTGSTSFRCGFLQRRRSVLVPVWKSLLPG